MASNTFDLNLVVFKTYYRNHQEKFDPSYPIFQDYSRSFETTWINWLSMTSYQWSVVTML